MEESYLKVLARSAQKFTIKHEYYNLKSVNDIIFNLNARIVSVFKDYLIMDDICDFFEANYVFGRKDEKGLKYALQQAKKSNNITF